MISHVHAAAQHDAAQRLAEGAVGDRHDGVADHDHLLEHVAVELPVGRVLVDVGDLDLVVAAHFQQAVVRLRLAQRGENRAQHEPHVAADGEALDRLLVAAGSSRTAPSPSGPAPAGQVGVFDLEEQPLAGFDLLDLARFAGERGADFLQGLDGPAVVASWKWPRPM